MAEKGFGEAAHASTPPAPAASMPAAVTSVGVAPAVTVDASRVDASSYCVWLDGGHHDDPVKWDTRDIELKQDLWLTAHPIGDDTDALALLHEGARRASNHGARTALLVALHAGHQDAALLLVSRRRGSNECA